MAERPTIRYVVPKMPWPLTSGMAQRQYSILRSLAAVGTVDMVILANGDPAIPTEISSPCRRAAVQPRGQSDPRDERSPLARTTCLSRQLLGSPIEERSLRPGEFRPGVRDILGGAYDLTWIARLQTAHAIRFHGGAGSVLDLDDVEHLKLQRLVRLRPTARERFRTRILARAWRMAEFRSVRQFDRAIVCSEQDRAYLASPSVCVIPNTVAVAANAHFSLGVPGRMLYVGLLSYRPNYDGVRFFIEQILPRICDKDACAHLRIVGGGAPAELKSLDDENSVRFLGRVPEMASHLAAAAISVVPLRIGGGTRLKILESLACKTPVVATSIGAEGLDLQHGKHLLLADTPDSFAGACLQLLHDPALRARLAEAGYERVRDQYDFPRLSERVISVVDGVVLNRLSLAKPDLVHSSLEGEHK